MLTLLHSERPKLYTILVFLSAVVLSHKFPDSLRLIGIYFRLFCIYFQTLSMSWFVESAKRYKLKGRSLEELCDHNASVARDLERHQVLLYYFYYYLILFSI